MNGYYLVKIKFSPFSSDSADLMAGFLADSGYESFEVEGDELFSYIKAEDFDKHTIETTIADFPIDTTITWTSEFIKGQDWNAEWEKNYFKPIIVQDKCLIRSSFHTDYPECEYEILIDPKMAFGTGHHATTSMMVGHLLENDLTGKTVIDMGTGTGILAILAKQRGAGDVTGIEIDGMAYNNAIENAALNNVDIHFIHGDASKLEGLFPADFFLANINRNIILADLATYIKHLKKDGKLIISGFYQKDVPILERAIQSFGMDIAKTINEGEWCSLAITFTK